MGGCGHHNVRSRIIKGHSIRKLKNHWATRSTRERSLNQQVKVIGGRVKMLQKRRPWGEKALGKDSAV